MLAAQLRRWLGMGSAWPGRGKGGAPRRLVYRPRLEPLEDRYAPALLTWTCASISLSNHWSVGSNWDLGRAPADGDELLFPDGTAGGSSFGRLSAESVNDIPNLTLASIQFRGFGSGPLNEVRDYHISGNAFSLLETADVFAAIQVDAGQDGISPRISCPIQLATTGSATHIITDFNARVFLGGRISGGGGIEKPSILSASASETNTGEVILEADNSYTGRTLVDAGVLAMGNSSALGAIGAADDTVVSPGAELVVAFAGTSKETLTVSGSHSSSEGALHGASFGTWGGPITLATDTSISAPDPFARFTILGKITGPGSLTKIGSGVLELAGSAANDYAGNTSVRSGTLYLSKAGAVPGNLAIGRPSGNPFAELVSVFHDRAIADTATVTVKQTGRLNLGASSQTVGALTMFGGEVQNGSLVLNGRVTATQDSVGRAALIDFDVGLTLGVPTHPFVVTSGPDPSRADLVIEGFVQGPGTFVKEGSGKLLFHGASGFTGGTTLAGGELVVNGNLSSSPCAVLAGTLSGSGLVGPLTAVGGAIEPTTAPATTITRLTVLDSLTLNSGATFRYVVSHPSGGALVTNRLRVIRSSASSPPTQIQLNGPRLVNDGPVQSQPGDSWLIVENADAAGSTSGTFTVRGQAIDGVVDPLVEFAPFRFSPDGVKSFTIDYHANSGNDVSLKDNTVAAKDLKVTPDVINEGQQVALTGTLFGAEPNGQFFLKILWGDGSPAELHQPGRSPFRFTHTYANNPAGQPHGGTYTITAFWFDEFGFGNHQTRTVTVNNVAPTVFLPAQIDVRPNGLLIVAGRFTDPGVQDRWTATVNYGDGTGTQKLKLSSDHHFVLQHRYQRPGTYRVTVTITDDAGESGTATLLAEVDLLRPHR